MLHPTFSDLKAVASKYAAQYQENQPFPNIYFDGFFNEDYLSDVLGEFPSLTKDGKNNYYENPNEKKFGTKGEFQFGPKSKQLVHFLNSEPFLEFLQELTGIKEGLVPDPYFEGGGFHQIKKDGFLKVHVDFHKHRKMNLDRRLNLLVYLNKDWKEEYGGHFELWKTDMSESQVRIAPLFNRMALFSTTGNSWHGHPDPLTCPPDRSRKSMALYYYTNGRPTHEINKKDEGRITTTFAARKGQDSSKMTAYNTAVNLANDILPKGVIKWIKTFRKT